MTIPAAELLPETYRVIQHGIAEGLHHGVQLTVTKNFQTIVDCAAGENRPGEPLTGDMLLPWLSAGKPLTATAILQHVESGLLELEQPIASIIPEFAASGKERITLLDLLTHQGGLKPIATGWPKRTWREIVDKICQSGTRRDRGDGLNCAYDPARSWFILGEILQRIDPQQRTIDRILREEILVPLEMTDSWMAIPADQFERFASRLAQTYTSKDGRLTPAPGNSEVYCTTPSPGGSLRGPIRDLSRFYEMLLRGGTTRTGQTLLRPETICKMVSRQREGKFDATFQHVVDFGLGIIINSNRYGSETVPYGFGRYASEEAFGHGGAQCSIGFADPEHQLVVTAVANGLPGEERHNQRFRELNSAIYEDLGLA